ncbi:MAG: hypothetical protein M1498_04170 [Candidatus Thermoplasmatota archaeon]|nr:hypothetical protein [Candidatus Thermoplasmatota archaeon]MCL5889302.1 hypothetical protein [Candidatus Thermoplasmatota archaeon]
MMPSSNSGFKISVVIVIAFFLLVIIPVTHTSTSNVNINKANYYESGYVGNVTPTTHVSTSNVNINKANYYESGYDGNNTLYIVNNIGSAYVPRCLYKSNESFTFADRQNRTISGIYSNIENNPNYSYHECADISNIPNAGVIGYCSHPNSSFPEFHICSDAAFSEKYTIYSELPTCVYSNLSNLNGLRQNISLNQVNDPGNVVSQTCGSFGIEGVNATGQNNINPGSSHSYNLILNSVSLIPGLGDVIDAGGIYYDGINLISPTGFNNHPCKTSSRYSLTCAKAKLEGGKQTHTTISGNPTYIFKDLFSYNACFNTYIPYTDNAVPMCFNLSGSTDGLQYGYDSPYYHIHVAPSNQIAGTVIFNNHSSSEDANQCVLITHAVSGTCEDIYHVKTNSFGEYRFFGLPCTNYNINVGNQSFSLRITGPSKTTFQNVSIPKKVPLIFLEQGLPSGTSWSVNSHFSSLSSITLMVDYDRSYLYHVGNSSLSGYNYIPSPSSGSAYISNPNQTVSIFFVPVSLIFNESGLHGNTWSVVINGDTLSTSGSGIVIPEQVNRLYSYSIITPSGYFSSPSCGSVYLGQSSTHSKITFTPTAYFDLKFCGFRLPSGHTWSVYVDGIEKYASTGSPITFSEPNGYFSYSPVTLFVPIAGRPGAYIEYYASGGIAHANGGEKTVNIFYNFMLLHKFILIKS